VIARIQEPGVGEELRCRFTQQRLLLKATQEKKRTKIFADAVGGEGRGIILDDPKESRHGR